MLQNKILQINDNGKQDNLFYEREDMYSVYKGKNKPGGMVLGITDNYNLN